MKRVIGYTDSITECECCGKTDLKGTFCLEIDGVELYYGSTCAFKSHGLNKEDQKILVSKFKSKQKVQDKLKEMEKEYSENPTFSHLLQMTKFVKANANKLDALSYFQKYGNCMESVSNNSEVLYWIPDTNLQMWFNK